MASRYIFSKTYADFEEQIGEIWELEAGYRLVDVEFIDDAFTGVFVDNNGANAYEEDAEFAEKFEQRSEQGYDLIDFEQVDDVLLRIYEQPNSLFSNVIETQGEIAGSQAVLSSIFSDF